MTESTQPLSLEEVLNEERQVIAKRKIHKGGKDTVRGEEFVDLTETTEAEALSGDFKTVWEDLASEEQNKRWAEYKAQGGHGGFIGLAFSGGGIRSATFGLGVLLVLMRLKLFQCVDYLSTVSGGGYLGSWWSSIRAGGDASVSAKDDGVEDACVRYLRNNAKYIAPNGLFDVLRIPAVLLRGAVINLIAITPYLLLAVLITYFMDVKNNESDCHGLTEKIYSGVVEYTQLGKGFVSAFSGNCEAQFSDVKLVIYDEKPGDLSFINRPFFYSAICMLFFVGFIVLFPILNMITERTSSFQDNAWAFRKRFDRSVVWFILVTAVIGFVEFQPIAIAFLKQQNFDLGLSEIGGYTGLYTLLSAGFVSKLRDRLTKLSSQLALILLGFVTFLVIWFLYLALSLWVIDGYRIDDGNDRLVLLCATLVVTLLYSLTFININITSLHNFYRDVLSKAYLVKRAADGSGRLIHNDSQKLSDLDAENGPYHLINSAINVSDRHGVYNADRRADFFLFSKNYIGSKPTGYKRTTDFEQVSDHINLGTAMAISGAAASPAMGKFSKQSVSFLLALFNIRLNYWFPNPARLVKGKAKGFWLSLKYRATSWYLIPELLGFLNTKSKLINLSDGGHLENLGVYELLRRQCRLIIVSDGECDPDLRFQGLLELIRMAKVDLAITIDMEGLDEIREGKKQFAVGNIYYAGGRIGKLMYLKLSIKKKQLEESEQHLAVEPLSDLSFDANSYMAYYKSQKPEFPHESTADQYFDEAQFECYRALGYQVAMSAFAKGE